MRVKRNWLVSLAWLNFGCLIFLTGCVSAPRVIQIPTTVALARPALRPSSDYQEILSAVVSVMWTDLKLPPTDGVVAFYTNRFALETALLRQFEEGVEEMEKRWLGPEAKETFRTKLRSTIFLQFEKHIEKEPEPVKQAFRTKAAVEFEDRFEKEFERMKESVRAKNDENITFAARQKAATVVAVTGHGRILVNELILARYSWSERIKTLAHELTHIIHQGLVAAPLPGLGLQEPLGELIDKAVNNNNTPPGLWVQEGFAEWVGYKVLDTLGVQTSSKSREHALDQIARARQYQTFPTLTQLVTAQDWQTWAGSLGLPATYGQAFLAMESLVDQKGLSAVVEYFRLFGKLSDHQQNFVLAFGEPVSAFEDKFDKYLQTLLGK